MAAIKPIEARSVHQIQSGQVIVDLCSVVKELVENSLDAGATALEVRFKNNGLDAIEVQDNGSGISPSNWNALALKHHTSKLASYGDLSSLDTFGFRGEALSSLCAVATFYAVTTLSDEAPKGHRLDFASSGHLKDTTVVAAPGGTTAVVEGLFESLPVRRKELAKNVKKEYGKALGLLHAYACIGTHVKFTVKSSMPKGKNATVFATKGNPTTRENIANVYGAKTLTALVPLDLQLKFPRILSQMRDTEDKDTRITIRGHVSRPVFGEGRQTPDRQMFFVNGRPCGLPQISKAFNEVYKSFNVSQSPFVFADLAMDTNGYDVNVSPDKRTILLHDSTVLVESLKSSLTELFDQHQQTVPQSQVQASRPPAFTQLGLAHQSLAHSVDRSGLGTRRTTRKEVSAVDKPEYKGNILLEQFGNEAFTSGSPIPPPPEDRNLESETFHSSPLRGEAEDIFELDGAEGLPEASQAADGPNPVEIERVIGTEAPSSSVSSGGQQARVPSQVLARHTAANQPSVATSTPPSTPPRTSVIQNAFDKMRPNRPVAELATITVGDKTTTTMVGRQTYNPNATSARQQSKSLPTRSPANPSTKAFTQKLKGFAASADPVIQDGLDSSAGVDLASEPDEQPPSSDDSPIGDETLYASQEGGEGGETASDDMQSVSSPKGDSDGEYTEMPDKKAQDAAVTDLIRAAEQKAASLNVHNFRRANQGLRHASSKDSTTRLQVIATASTEQIQWLAGSLQRSIRETSRRATTPGKNNLDQVTNEEERLNLTISKTDFSQMHIVGQFNLGFILAIRAPAAMDVDACSVRSGDELFIIDQHASDERFNFERLQEETVVGSQRLVRPKQLDLTAVEEEILTENISALEKNGFLASVDASGDEPIGQRCKLTSVPLSKQVAFGLEDLEELLHLLAESPSLSQSAAVPRPSKVRKMFAMRACRSSIMIGKSLTEQSMRTVVSHMGDIDKPWNCPHGRPTMRHLMSLNTFNTWREGDGTDGKAGDMADELNLWIRYAT